MVYYLGYKCPWEKFPSMEFVDGDPFQVTLVDTSIEAIVATAGSRQHATLGYRINPEHVPTVLKWKSRHSIPDFEGPQGFLCVSSKLKAIIEQFEPGVHQFFPLKVVNKAGEHIADHWLWVVCNRIDSVDREHTTFVMDAGGWRNNYFQGDKRIWLDKPELIFSKAQTEGYHFWRDKHLLSTGIFCSDEAAEMLQAANLIALSVDSARTI
jgi:hypothetical protein